MPVLDGGACQVGIESSIVSVAADGSWQLLRPGMISEADICRVAGQPQQLVGNNTPLTAAPKAPGQHALHYSPRTPLLLFNDRASLMLGFEQCQQSGLRCAALLIGSGEQPNCPTTQLNSVPAEVAEQLYNTLHDLDALKVDRLLVQLPAASPEWVAVLDRLQRAGHSEQG
jgi:L-threonylcarbamoyladenylate synthase